MIDDRILPHQVNEYLGYVIGHVERYGFQPSYKEAARHFRMSERMVRNWVDCAAIMGMITPVPVRKERSVAINWVTYEAFRTDRTAEWPPEFLEIAAEQGSRHSTPSEEDDAMLLPEGEAIPVERPSETPPRLGRRVNQARVNELYLYLLNHVKQYGCQPTCVEAASYFGVDNRTIRNWIDELVEAGRVAYMARKERCVLLLGVEFKAIRSNIPAEVPPEIALRVAEL